MQLKQAALLTVFVAYVAIIPLFGLAYFLLYRRRRSHFVFAGDIYSSRLSEERQDAEDRISWLRALLEYFQSFAADHRHGVAREEYSNERATLQLSNSCSVVLEKHTMHVPAGGASELAPFVRLLRADGTSLREGSIVGHGFLSGFRNGTEYVLAAIAPLTEDLRRAEEYRVALESPGPQIWRYLDFLYFSTITQSTVGYGDILPNSTLVRSIVMLQIVMGYALLVVVLNTVLGS